MENPINNGQINLNMFLNTQNSRIVRKNMDRRVIRTKKAIRMSFIDLLKENEINDITVTDIANKADINRKTFYNYYNNVYELLDEIENEVTTSFEKILKEMENNQTVNNPSAVFINLTYIINNDIEFYNHLLAYHSHSHLVEKITFSLKKTLYTSLSKELSIDDYQLEIMIDFIIGGIVSIYQSWFNHQESCTIEQLSQATETLIFDGVSHYIEKNTR